jgi:hypothetical protein
VAFDRRMTPTNGRVAAQELRGQVDAQSFVAGELRRCVVPVVDLLAGPDAGRDRQILYGESVRVFEQVDGVCFVQAEKDGYVGYVVADALAECPVPTHRVGVPATHLYPQPDLKCHEDVWLSFGSRVRVVSASGGFFETHTGQFVPKPHLRPLNAPFADAVTVAQMHFGVPYLWGGNSSAGIDCSGLVQTAMIAAGFECAGDSDLQERQLGRRLPDGSASVRGDLWFWPGHVAIMVDEHTLIHANAHQMAVGYEDLDEATARIAQTQGMEPTAHRRLG